MALRQPCAYRADLWRRDAGGGSPLSPVSGADPERPAQAISCVVCPVLSRLLNHVRCKGTEPWSATTVGLLLLWAMLPHTLRGLLDVWGGDTPLVLCQGAWGTTCERPIDRPGASAYDEHCERHANHEQVILEALPLLG